MTALLQRLADELKRCAWCLSLFVVFTVLAYAVFGDYWIPMVLCLLFFVSCLGRK